MIKMLNISQPRSSGLSLTASKRPWERGWTVERLQFIAVKRTARAQFLPNCSL